MINMNIKLLGLGTLLVIGGIGLFISSNPPSPYKTITLKDVGFTPKSVHIAQGETVRFLNKSSHSFWPASDNHPAHDLYEGFDAGRPIEPGESWNFTFTDEGVWWFHDHLRPYFRGYVAVGDVDENTSCIDDIGTISDKQACWERELANTLEEDGVKAAFQEFSEIYRSYPEEFSSIGCHWMAHKLGETEYGEYLKHKDFSKLEFPQETTYCGYGFYHGFLEHLLRDNPDYQLADSLCKELIGSLEEDVPRIRLNCYHAIGHGFVPEPIDLETWGNPRELVAPALTACGNIVESDARQECYQGTFNVIADWMWNNQFGLYYPKDTPLELCGTFGAYEINSACYYEVSMRLNPSVHNDITDAFDTYISDIPDKLIAGTVLNSFAASALGQRITESDFSDLVFECRELPDWIQKDCMKGLTGAFIAHGEPDVEYVKALDFCEQPFLFENERDICYWNITRTFKGAYPRSKVEEICKEIPEPYVRYCSYDFTYD